MHLHSAPGCLGNRIWAGSRCPSINLRQHAAFIKDGGEVIDGNGAGKNAGLDGRMEPRPAFRVSVAVDGAGARQQPQARQPLVAGSPNTSRSTLL